MATIMFFLLLSHSCSAQDFSVANFRLLPNDVSVFMDNVRDLNDEHKPRIVTLDALAQFIGYNNYVEFTQWLKNNTKYNSSFFIAKQLISADLEKGTEIHIGWSSNRILKRCRHPTDRHLPNLYAP